MKFMWVVVAILVIMAIVVTLFSVFSDCSGDEEDEGAAVCISVYEASCVQEPACQGWELCA